MTRKELFGSSTPPRKQTALKISESPENGLQIQVTDCPTAQDLLSRGCILLCSECIVKMYFEQVESSSSSDDKSESDKDLKNVKMIYKMKPWNCNISADDSKLPNCNII